MNQEKDKYATHTLFVKRCSQIVNKLLQIDEFERTVLETQILEALEEMLPISARNCHGLYENKF